MRFPRVILPIAATAFIATTLAACLPLPDSPEFVRLTPYAVDGSVEPDPEPEGTPVGTCPWESEPVEEGTGWIEWRTGAANPSADTEAIALDDAEFWALVESIPPAPNDADFTAVASALAGCSIRDVIGFEARLTLALAALDGPENWDWFEQNDPSGFGWASDDVFLYARCAAVLGGQESWSAAVAERTVDWGSDPPDLEGYSELLLYVAVDAANAQGVSTDEFYEARNGLVLISYESGTNPERWD
jgi:hypothetical protein